MFTFAQFQQLSIDFFGYGLVFWGLELLTHYTEFKPLRRGALNDILHFFTNSILRVVILGAVVSLSYRYAQDLILFDLAARLENLWLPLVFLGALFAEQFGFYWAHRWSHEIPFLWKFHAVHHTIEEMDWLSTNRAHPFDNLFLRILGFGPVFLFGFSPQMYLFALTVQGVSALFIHSNCRFRFGFAEKILATPFYHQWHHSYDVFNKNYCSLFAFFDLLFGTYYSPAARPAKLGISQNVPATNFLFQLLYPLESNLYNHKVFAQKRVPTPANPST